MSHITIPTDGQIILSKAVSDELGWEPGTQLEVETRGGTVVLRPERKRVFPLTSPEQVRGCLAHLYHGPSQTIEEMDEGIAKALGEDDARTRY